MKHKEYSAENLYQDINNLNRMEHPFSIIGIKDSYNEYANRYLLYYDSRWNCYLFPNRRTDENEKKNEESLLRYLSNSLKIPGRELSLEKLGERIHRKFSVSGGRMKWYHHTFYQIHVSLFPEELKKQEFTVDGINYRWMTLAQMEQDERISEVNGDVVKMVKELYG